MSIALGAASPVFASLPAVVSACLPLLEFACLVELAGYFRRSRSEPVGCVRLGRLRRAGGRRCLGRFRYLGRGGLVCRGFCLFVCLAGVVIGRLRFFQIVEERISPGYELVGMGFILPCSKFTVINSSFLPFEAVAALAELRFARVFLRFCRHDLTAQLLNMLLNSCAGLLVAECFKCLV